MHTIKTILTGFITTLLTFGPSLAVLIVKMGG